jgi:RNA polymerase sigma-70 factor (ECF subfamily)
VSSDSDIIRRSRDTPAAFSELYDRHAATIHRYAARRADASTADDIMSETFLVAFERRADFDHEREDARPWLYGIATVLLRKHARLEARAWKGLRAAGAAEIPSDTIDALGSRVDAEVAIRRLASAIRRMPARDRDTLLLFAWADLDYEGVAQALDIPIGTVRSRLNRARRTLRAMAGRGPSPVEEVEDGQLDPATQRA